MGVRCADHLGVDHLDVGYLGVDHLGGCSAFAHHRVEWCSSGAVLPPSSVEALGP